MCVKFKKLRRHSMVYMAFSVKKLLLIGQWFLGPGIKDTGDKK